MDDINDLLRDIFNLLGGDSKGDEDENEGEDRAVVENIPMDALIPVSFLKKQIMLQGLASLAKGHPEIGKAVEGIVSLMIEHWKELEPKEKIKWLK